MDEAVYGEVFKQFLYDYWGAFHEVLEAQSVTPKRLAGSLFSALRAQHRAFAAAYEGSPRRDVATLGAIWQALEAERHHLPDLPLKHGDVIRARRCLERIYDALLRHGKAFGGTTAEILVHAPHGTPREPLQADSGR
jgi:hypothetical protein